MAFKFADKLKEKENYNNTMIVDALNLAFRWKHTNNYNNYKEEFLRTVQSLARSYEAKKIIITADWGASTFRKTIYPEYKADRKERYKDQTDEEKAIFEAFFNEFESTLEYLANEYIVLRFSGVEADDIAAHLVKNKKQYELENIWLISSDGDWDLLVSEDVSRFSFRTRKETTKENWEEHYKVCQDDFISYKCLLGDSSDNIPGIVGVGPVRAASLVNTYGSAFDIYDRIPIKGNAQYIKNLNDSAETLLTNYQLMDLLTYCDEAIGKENIEQIRATLGDVAW